MQAFANPVPPGRCGLHNAPTAETMRTGELFFMRHRVSSVLFASSLTAFGLGFVGACGAPSSGGSPGGSAIVDGGVAIADGGGSGSATLRTRLVVPPTRNARQDGFGTSSAALSGQNAAADLMELSYAVRAIAICKHMTVQDTGFSNPLDCLEVYAGPEVPSLAYDPSADLLPLAAAARSVDEPFVDLLSAAGRARLATSHTLTLADVREYQYGYITWYPPIKLRGSVAIPSGPTLHTLDGTTSVVVMPDGFRQYVTTSASSLSAATTSERAVVLLPNGGNWFKFQRPLAITEADVTSATASDAGDAAAATGTSGGFDLDLVFDPEAMLTAFSERSGDSNSSLVDSSGAGFHVPMLDLAPIVRTAGKTLVREDWVADLGAGFGYRLSLYGVEPDANRTIYGVLSRMLVNANTVAAGDWFDSQKIAGVTVATDGTRTFTDPSGEPIVRGFTRTASSADAGTSVSAELRCTGHDERPMPHGFFLPGCATGTWRPVTFVAR